VVTDAAPEELAPSAPVAMADMAMEPTAKMAVRGIVADQIVAPPQSGTEAFANADPNPVKVTVEEPVSTFSIDVDTASYAVIRQSLMGGFLPDPDAVRVEEMVNYFPYSYPAPTGDQAFQPQVTVMPTPWNPETRLVRIGIQGAMPAVADRPALNLVFLIDTSGSMDEPMKLPLLRQSLALMLPDLRDQDQIAIVAYAGSAGVVLEPTPASDRAAILSALDRLSAGGGTAGAEGIALAYQMAEKMKSGDEVSRVLLATDGDFNLGVADPEGLTKLIEGQRDSGTYLSVLGFGRGNLDDATMQALAQNGNGTAAYIDTLAEARKVLGDQLTGALFPIADNVKIQVEWNPAAVAEYRLIGYETRALAREDFNNDAVDAGDIGAGVQVTALYEVTAPGSAALLNDPLRYQAATPVPGDIAELGYLRLRHVPVGGTDSILIEQAITITDGPADDDARFAAAIAGFGQMLRGGDHLNGWGWDQMIALADGARGSDPHGYRVEAVELMRLAQALGR
jgi:Ca-activated chloride channel family protein